MKGTSKVLAALAAGSIGMAPAAFADVTISGSINMGIEYLNVGKESDTFANARNVAGFGTAQPHSGVGNFGLASNYTNITIASTEDLGNGLRLDLAAQINWSTVNTDGLSNRNSHIGLVSDSWGGVWYGANESLYERYLYLTDPIDKAAGLGGNLQILGTPGGAVFGSCNKGDVSSAGTNNTFPGSCGYTFYRRDAQVIWYDSPDWNGFTFGVVLQTDFDKQSQPNVTINPWSWQLGAKYVGTDLPLQAWGAYARRSDQFGLTSFLATYSAAAATGTGAAGPALTTGATDSTDSAWQLGAGYTLGDVYFFGIYEQLKYSNSGVTAGFQEWKRNAYQLGMKWNLATGYIGASWMQAMSGSCKFVTAVGLGCNDTGAYNVNAGYYHTMSKQTQVYIVGSWLDNQDAANYGTAGISNAAVFRNVGATVYGLGVGIVTSF